MNTIAKVKKIEKPKPKAEDSVNLRVVACLIALLCILVAAGYTRMHLVWGILYFWLTITGSYVSFYLRNRRIGWLSLLIGAGLIGVMLKFAFEIYLEFKVGRIEGLIPFIHVLIGLLTLQAFDLETRTDINISVLIALGLFTCTAVIGTDLKFGFFVLLLIVLGAVMLYFESISRTRANECPVQEGVPPVIYAQTTRQNSGVGLLPVLSIPALGLIFFMFLPRVDSVFDTIVSYVHKMSGKNNPRLSYLPGLEDGGVDEKGKGKGVGGKTNMIAQIDDPVGLAKHMSATRTATNVDQSSENGKPANGIAPGGPGSKAGDQSANAPGGSASRNTGGGKGQATAGKDGKVPGAPSMPSPGNDRSSQSNSAATGPQTQETDDLVFRDAQNSANDDKLLLYISSEESVYLRRMYFDKFDGHHWTVSHHSKVANCEKLQGEYAELGGVPALHVAPDVKTKEVKQHISIMSNIGHVLPTADIPQSVAIGEEKITVDDFGVLRSKSVLKDITNYEVISKVPVFDLDALRRMPTSDSLPQFQKQYAAYLQVPESTLNDIEAQAQSIAGTDGNWFVKAEKINNYLKTHYKYSTEPFVDNPDVDLVSDFLFKKKQGACGQFASSFVIECRTIGIPARMVGGFSPGEYDSQADRREIRSRDGHSWGEIYLPDAGWIPFDPTPSGTLPTPPENVNQIVAAVDRALKDMAATFSAQQLDHQLSHGRDENYPVKMQDVKVRGLKSSVKDVTRPNIDLAKKGSAGNSGPALKPPSAPGEDSEQEKSRGLNFDDENNLKKKRPPSWVVLAAGAGVLLLFALAGAAFYFRSHLRRLIFKSEFPRVAKGVKPSTLVFLKLSDDLRKLKVLRRPSDTAEELSKRFFENYSEDEPCHPELPSLFAEFLELYSVDRFSTAENSVENYRQLRDLGTRIHSLARTKYVDKAS